MFSKKANKSNHTDFLFVFNSLHLVPSFMTDPPPIPPSPNYMPIPARLRGKTRSEVKLGKKGEVGGVLRFGFSHYPVLI